ncbi:UDP-N-acetylmuramate dehydrogenase [Teredinibacter turnerae]|uniref:UDP-N-acetylmuramate dehydrogenase n=1 Tax=Teredinibacter turnerae TaxID=2426 RepID=UPI0005F7ED5F|nr:UDP-N-acetylmuramate dehydrogenase [Teredinibacter turnerae]
MKIEEHVNLQPLNTLAVPASARFFARATSEQELRQALRWAQKHERTVAILGGGSNCLLPEKVTGLVVQPALRGINVIEEGDRYTIVRAAAGENWHRFVLWTLGQSLCGIENLALIPGSVGAAPIQNIGAYGVELQDVFLGLRAVNRKTLDVVEFNAAACEFGYRESVFKNRLRDQYVIVSVDFRLRRTPEFRVDYPALKAALAGISRSRLTAEVIAHTVATIRREKLPDPSVIPNCGSFFKNPVVANAVVNELKGLYPDIVYYPAAEGYSKIAAGWLIEKSGWKGKQAFDARVHDRQALVLTNPLHKSAKNVIKLAGAIQSSIRQRYGIELEVEPQWLGA